MTVQTFRDAIVQTAPKWLRGFWGARFLYALGVQLDAVGDAVVASVKMRMPGLYDHETLPLIGRQRRLTRTPTETDAQYAARLEQWRQVNGRRGNPFALMEQIRAHLAPDAVRVAVVNNQGHRLEIETDGTPSVVGATSWDWDGDADRWSRCWVILYDADWVAEPVIGAGPPIGDYPGTIGSSATTVEVGRVRTIVNEWGAAHARIVNTIVVLDETAWELAQPDGDWDWEENRNAAVVYWKGSGP